MTAEIVSADFDHLTVATKKFMNTDANRAYLEAPGSLAYVAVDEGEVVGWVWGYQLIRPDGPPMIYVHQLKVAESHRRQGLGRGLMCAFMDAGRAAGATKMFLTTGADRAPARALYESLGGGLAAQGPTANYWFLLDR
ncbi:acetyltransferase (GNAT) family protein [Kribbella amoyensis]|uniref:Acetyltransferase (GNAT) family protein n=1 Tax=Kribbella amoyensis TaxID=996641 RepID=A0A561BMD9_9ACTN|nr:GNAT family N-acetyltransferase [Kribbella amoyensis]TWD80003.1 acetyltransferase (GNAT) family protein [Kribbella amoyensis]